MVAGVVAMVPEGLVLLTSLAFAIAAVTLARRQVLVQELPAVEGLARVDVVLPRQDRHAHRRRRSSSTTSRPLDDDVPGARRARRARRRPEPATRPRARSREAFADAARAGRAPRHVPFSSARKWSGATFAGSGTWVFGAPEMVWVGRPADDPVRGRADELAPRAGACSCSRTPTPPFVGEELPTASRAVALGAVRGEDPRPTPPTRCAYFRQQGVALKVISGDNPRTVAAVARAVGLDGAEQAGRCPRAPRRLDALADVLERRGGVRAGLARTRSGRSSARSRAAGTSWR